MTAPQTPFRTVTPLDQRSWLARLFRRGNPGGASAEIQNLLATRPIAEVPSSEISAILLKHKVAGRAARDLAKTLWSKALTEFARDDDLSGDESKYLTQLRAAFGLAERDVAEMQADFAKRHYSEILSSAMGDRRLSEEEWTRLNRWIESSGVSKAARDLAHGEGVKGAYQSALQSAIADRRLSPTEETALRELAINLGLSPSYELDTAAGLQKFAYLWQIENADLPLVPVPIALQKRELCHWSGQAEWHELRTRTVRTGYSGPVATIRIARGLSYRVASYTPSRITREELTHIDSGTAYVTNKRVIFDGSNKNTTIRYSSLLGIEVFSDAIKLEKASGRSPYLMLSGDTEIPAAILSEALARADR